MNTSPSRRTILKAFGLAAMASAFLGPRKSRADDATPKRFIWVSTPVGTMMDKLWNGPDFDGLFKSGNILAPDDSAGFSSLKQKLLVLRGIDAKTALIDPRPIDHQPDYLNMLIARQPKDIDGAKPAGISLDQLIANKIGGLTPFASVQLGTTKVNNPANTFVATGANQPVSPIEDPRDAFHQLFDGFAGTPAQQSKRNAERLSVLDTVSGELTALEKRLSCDERLKLGTHVAAIEELEKQINLVPAASCVVPGEPGDFSYDGGNDYPAIVKAHIDIAVAAMACDLTRVLTLQLGRRLMSHPWLGIPYEHHVLAHYNAAGKTEQQQRDMQAEIEHWYAQQFYYLIRKLDAIPDVNGGTMLDNTVVVWAHEQATGSGHSRKDFPYVLAGSCGGAIPTGHRKDFRNGSGEGPAHNGLLITLANAMGLDIEQFGDPNFSNGPLSLA